MRIISGKHKGRVLKEFKGDDIRPTSDRAKEALFNIISSRIYGATVLELFSGTGSVGIEFISRGAGSVTFVDKSKDSVNIIKTNLSLIKETAKVENISAENFLIKTADRYDIIFLDPPYAYENADSLFEIIKNRNLLTDGGVIVYERKSSYEFKSLHFEIYDTRKYGLASFDFLRRKV